VKPPRPVEGCSESTVAWWKNPGIIYFIAAGEPPVAIKIGMAAITGNRDLKAAVERRLSQIQSSNNERLRLLGVIHFTHDTYGLYPTQCAEAKERESCIMNLSISVALPHASAARSGSILRPSFWRVSKKSQRSPRLCSFQDHSPR